MRVNIILARIFAFIIKRNYQIKNSYKYFTDRLKTLLQTHFLDDILLLNDTLDFYKNGLAHE